MAPPDKAQREWDALRAEQERLQAEVDRLQRQDPPDHEAQGGLIAALAALRKRLVAWRERYLPRG